MKFLIWLILIIIWLVVLKYRYQVYDFTGEFDWAQKYFGSTGTLFVIILIGAILIFSGVAYPLGGFGGFEPINVQQTTTTK